MQAVDRARQNARGAGLSRAARAAEKVCVRRAVRFHLMLEGCGNMFLPDYVRKTGRTVLSVKRAVSHAAVLPNSYVQQL
jgi:hypothetical protein